jgi:hypothetical protein
MPRLSTAARRQLARGTRVELEHTRSRKLARLIAAHHLSESSKYYVELAKMEKKLMKNPIEEISPALRRVILEEARKVFDETQGNSNADWLLLGTVDIVDRNTGDTHKLSVWQGEENDELCIQWFIGKPLETPKGVRLMQIGGGFLTVDSEAAYERNAAIVMTYRRHGLYQTILKALRRIIDLPIYSDIMRSQGCDLAWSRLQDAGEPVKSLGMRWKYNPAPHVPVMSYGAAHRWEALAKSKGVSAVARSPRGFMRAYEKAGTWARLDPWWKARRNAFVARHMAQVRQNGEKLWKPDRSGKLQPSRRCLALLMWAYKP